MCMCVDFSTFGLRIRCCQVTFSIRLMLGSQPRLSPVLSALLIASLHPLPGFTVRFGLLPSAPSHGRLVLAWLSLVSRRRRLSCLCYHCGCVAAVPSLGDGICAYRCRTVVGGRYLCLVLPYHRCEMVYVLLHRCTDPARGLYLCLHAVSACQRVSFVLLLLVFAFLCY